MRELLALLVANVRRRWQEWRDRRVLAGDAVVVEAERWSEVDPAPFDDGGVVEQRRTSSLHDDMRSRIPMRVR